MIFKDLFFWNISCRYKYDWADTQVILSTDTSVFSAETTPGGHMLGKLKEWTGHIRVKLNMKNDGIGDPPM